MRGIETADVWELVVPGDDAELAAEFRRHGIEPGQRVRVAATEGGAVEAGEEPPGFFASFDGPADLGERSGEILRAEFPAAR
jgi:hypothetical protein